MNAVSQALRTALERHLERLWYDPKPGLAERLARVLLAPASALAGRVARQRRAAIAGRPRPTGPPVVVIGNLVVGGTGKTPAVIALANAMTARGWRVGLLCGGYRARRQDARMVSAVSDADEHGDEAVLLARATRLPVAAGKHRDQALIVLKREYPGLQVVLSDDGMQHAPLARTLEVAVFDARGAGNGRMLPGGPLREPLAHAGSVDAIPLSGTDRMPCETPVPRFRVDLEPLAWRALLGAQTMSLTDFARHARSTPAVALAGISRPRRFFDLLARLGVDARPLPLGDHARLDADFLAGIDAPLVLMTTKDAVKCAAFADDRCWALETGARLDPAFVDWLEERLRGQPPA